jgi:beta-lactamase class A
MRLSRWRFNFFPAYRSTGARIEYIAGDWREVRVRLPLSWRTRNYVGTIFGGSLYAAVDPIYMIMLIKLLGTRYEVWDKAATVQFRRPGRSTLRATFRLDGTELEAIEAEVGERGRSERRYAVELVDEAGEVCASCEKVLSIRARAGRPAEGPGRKRERSEAKESLGPGPARSGQRVAAPLGSAVGRRALLGAASAVLAEACAGSARSGKRPAAAGPLARLEQGVGGRMGVCAIDSSSGAGVEHRADERFAMCSTFKWALVAAVLARVDRAALALDQPILYAERDLLSHAPVTRAHVTEGRMTIEDLARAAMLESDNTAANLLLAQVDGPRGVTRFFRELGDEVTRLDRNEPSLNTNVMGDVRDTTTPRAMAFALRAALAGGVLSRASRERLSRWLVECQTGRSRLRAGFPAGWTAGDKTGTGENGACNDVAVVWPPAGGPWFVAAYMSGSSASATELNAAHAEVGRMVAALVVRGCAPCASR